MYEKFFSLSQRPFAAAPNLECIVAHEGYVTARENLLRCLTDGCGTAVLTAPAGVGKSLLCQDLQTRLRGRFTAAYLCSAQFPNRKAMLQAILFELGADYLGLSEDEARLGIMQAAREAHDRGRGLVLIVDEAHLVSTELLQELRSLSEPSSKCSTPVRLMLSGQFELEERLADPALESLNQRIACHAILEPLSQSESADYIHERLAIAGAKTQAFSEEALAFIVKAADGNPRAIHQLCDHCLLSSYTIEEKPVSLETARNSLEDLRALPVHWNDAGLLDAEPAIADELEEAEDDEFVSTVAAEALNDASSSDVTSVGRELTAPAWEAASSVGVFEIGGADDQPVLTDSLPEAALFASSAPWPAVPVEAGMFDADIGAPSVEFSEFRSPIGGVILENGEVMIESSPAASDVDDESCQRTPDDDLAATGFTLNTELAASDGFEVETETEEATGPAIWSYEAESLSEPEIENEELVVSDRYAALDRATEPYARAFPRAPELIQFLAQYAVGEEPRREVAMHQPVTTAADQGSDCQEEELLATIRGLQEQLRQATSQRPVAFEPADAWKEAAGAESYDIVEPPQDPPAEPAAPLPVVPQEMSQVVEAPPVTSAPAVEPHLEPVKSRFAQLFSRMRQRRREVEDRLRRNVEWI